MNSSRAAYEHLRSRQNPRGFPSSAVLPDYDGCSIQRVPDLIAAALGLSTPAGRLLDVVSPPRRSRVLLVILDGIGYGRWNELMAASPDVRTLSERALLLPITTVFPSTTVAALSTYSTGVAPAEHGLLGYRLYLREISATVNMIQLTVVGGRAEPSLPESLSSEALMRSRTVYERLGDEDVDTYALLPRGIADSGLSRMLYRGATHIHPAVGLSDMLALARHILARAVKRTVVTLYWPGLDSIAHPRGAASDSYDAEAASIAASLQREIIGQVDDTLLLVSSDHGFAAMRSSDYVPVESIPRLKDALLLFPVGEPRASYLYLRPEATALHQASPEVAEHDLLFVDPRNALSLGLFGRGPEHPEAHARLGDLLAISTGPRGLVHPYPDAPFLPGMHGGLTADEMIVPLLAAAL